MNKPNTPLCRNCGHDYCTACNPPRKKSGKTFGGSLGFSSVAETKPGEGPNLEDVHGWLRSMTVALEDIAYSLRKMSGREK